MLRVTFSIVARSDDGESWGIAVASKFLAVGSVVPAAVAGIGAVASQAWANVAYKGLALAHLDEGATAQVALDRLLADDEGRDHRQVGIVDCDGGAATHTGSECMTWAGGVTGSGFAIQGNILTGPEVVEAMRAAMDEALAGPGPTSTGMAGALLACLRAGQDAGGDSRGQQSAAVLVADTLAGFQYPVLLDVDLRADNSPTPLDDLEEMLALKGRSHPAPAEVVPSTEVPHRPEDEGLWSTVLS